jgi:hypothetical protein
MFEKPYSCRGRLQKNSSPRVVYSCCTNFRRFAGLVTLLVAFLGAMGCGVRRSDLGEIVTDFPEEPTAKTTGTKSAAPPAQQSGTAESASGQSTAGDEGQKAADQGAAAEPPK